VFTAGAFAQSPFIADAKGDYDMIKASLLRAAEKVPEADYSFKATPEVRTFGELVGHAAEIQTMLCATVSGSGAKPAPAKKTKAEIVEVLKASFSECDKAYLAINEKNATESVKLPWMSRSKLGILNFVNEHSNETYGTMVPYMRLKGIVPPSSERRP
jgi:hypothetical protein